MSVAMDLLKDMILASQELPFPVFHERSLKVTPMPKKATICLGVRRCGKSTYMQQLMEGLVASGVHRENIVHLNFSDERLFLLLRSGAVPVDDAYYQLYPEKKNREKVYFFFDEIQLFPNWAMFVDRLMRNELCEVYLTGSSAKLLSTDIATEMRGRSLSWEMFPFSYGEYVKSKGVDMSSRLSPTKRLFIQQYWSEYKERGGFPEVLFSPAEGDVGIDVQIRILQEYFRSILLCDIVERHEVRDVDQVKTLAIKLIHQMGCMVSVNKLFNDLKSMNFKTSHTSVSEYMQWLEDAYFFFFVPIFDASFSKRDKSPKKVYVIDHALANAVGSGILKNRGFVLENIVYMVLRRVTKRVYYYKSPSGRHDVDFVAISESSEDKILVQVSESLNAPETRKREISSLRDAMRSSGLTQAKAFIITEAERDSIEVEEGVITILPAWDFIIKLESGEIVF